MQLQENTFYMRGNRVFPRKQGLRLRVTDNGDGTATWYLSGYRLNPDVDQVQIAWSIDPEDLDPLVAPPNLESYSPGTLSGTITLNDPAQPWYFRYRELDTGPNVVLTSNIYGPLTITGDTDATEWINNVVAEGWTKDGVRDPAMLFLVQNMKTVGGWHCIYSLGLTCFGSANPNRVRAKIGGLITFIGGSNVLHRTDDVKFTSDAFARLGFSPVDAGNTSSSCGVMAAVTELTPSANSNDLAVFSASTGTFYLLTANNSGSGIWYAGLPFPGSANDGDPGIYFGGNNSTEKYFGYADSSGANVLGIAGAGTVDPPDAQLALGAMNLSDTGYQNATNSGYGGWLSYNENEVSSTLAEDMADILYTTLQMIGVY